jgi:hypothetical protein
VEEVKETPSFSFFQNSVSKERGDDEAAAENLLERRQAIHAGLPKPAGDNHLDEYH